MSPENRRSDELRSSTRALLAAGEQPHIEFKSIVVKSAIAKQVASGANYVAFQPAAEVHTIIFGVAEEDNAATGVTVGSIVGLFSEAGGPADLDSLQLQIEQTIHSNVRPQPKIAIYQENVSTAPILVLEVRPTSAPHVVDERWLMRGVGGVRAMSQAEALQIFKRQRLSAWIDEFGDSDPLKRALAGIQHSIDDLRLAQFPTEPSDAVGGLVNASVDTVSDSLQSIDFKVGEVMDALVEVNQRVLEPTGTARDVTAEQAWATVTDSRQLRMHTIYLCASSLGAQRVALLDGLFCEFLGATAEYSAFAQNLAESAVYRMIRRAGEGLSKELNAAADLISAALWRRNGMPPQFGFDWLDEVRRTEDLLSEAQGLRSPLFGDDRVGGVDAESGVLELPGVSVEMVLRALDGALSLNQKLMSVRTPTGVYWWAVPESCSIWPVVFAPGVRIDVDAVAEMPTVSAAISTLVSRSGGSSWCVEGPGVAIPTS
ncbi:helix-turn-helix domain-containing protein [Cryobacterium psychrophilum]|uniref:ATP-binding protein n=1 Tax=Cryobacterium psychrophilum TaxID=41988 RepID=A0A4Y8KR70_9MICO|nr:ATP-binding protein [Cryobacterium psychrophilum]TDW31302.1 hypothetical protein EDD25_3108 [Cryobacterium psychrophilum]TFD78414.1 ATP-binding protein [Cryobacterium psychrophilum]